MAMVLALLANSAGCSSDETAAEAKCSGQGGTECAAFCGSDQVASLVCVDGEWKCPSGYVRGTTECPAGTCFGPPQECCSATGARTPMTCEPFEGGLPSTGSCPPGSTATLKGGPCAYADAGDAVGTLDADTDSGEKDASTDGGWTCPFQRLDPYGVACSGTSPCTRVASCQGGPQTFEYTCDNGYWKFVPKPCDPNKPYDSCGDFLWCSGANWSKYDGLEEPKPCPGSLPTAGSACYPTYGGIQTPCGYPCDPQTKTGWTIASCVNYEWILNAACE